MPNQQTGQQPGQNVAVAKKYVDGAAALATKIQAASDAAKKMQAAGEDINLIRKALASMSYLPEIGTILQVISAGLSVAQFFLPMKTKEDQILDGIKEITGRVESLRTDLTAQLKSLGLELELFGDKATLAPFIAVVESGNDTLGSIADTRLTGGSPDFASVQIDDLVGKDFSTAFRMFYDFSTGTGVADNFIEKAYQQSYGNAGTVTQLADYLTTMAMLAVTLDAFKKGVLARRQHEANGTTIDDDARVALADSIGTFYHDKLATIGDNGMTWSNRCIDPDARADQIERYYQDNRFGLMAVIGADKQGSATRIVDRLGTQWPYLNFTAIVYGPLAGFDSHAFRASAHCTISHFRKNDLAGQPVNVVIYWANRRDGAKRKRSTPPDQPLVWNTRVGQSKEAHWDPTHVLFGQLNAYPHDRNRLTGWRNLDRVKDISTYFAQYTMLLDPAHPGLQGGMVWAAWIEGPEFDVGLASDNPCLLVSNAQNFQISNRDTIYVTEDYHRVITVWPT